MSLPLDLNMDFQDFAPTNVQSEISDASSSGRDNSGVQIRIPDSVSQPSTGKGATGTDSGTSGGLFQNLLQSATGMGQSGLSEESLRQLMWASSKLRQQSQKPPAAASGSNWGLSYFAQYFDVDTNEVLERIIWSAIPLRKTGLDFESLDDAELIAPLAGGTSQSNIFTSDGQVKSFPATRQRPYSYAERFIQSRPDLYGPFWVSATLVFVIGIFSNLVSFLNYNSKFETLTTSPTSATNKGNNTNQFNQPAEIISNQVASNLDGWHYSMEELNIMSSLVVVYVTVLPAFMWLLFWFRGCSKCYTLTETVCAYGYSLSIFIPLSLLLTIQAALFRYLVLALALATSGTVLTLSFLPIVRSDPHPASSHLVLAIVPLCHLGLAYVIHRLMQP